MTGPAAYPGAAQRLQTASPPSPEWKHTSPGGHATRVSDGHVESCALPSDLGCSLLLTNVVVFRLANPHVVHCRYTREAYLELIHHVRESIPGRGSL